jgi:hypothetical protein
MTSHRLLPVPHRLAKLSESEIKVGKVDKEISMIGEELKGTLKMSSGRKKITILGLSPAKGEVEITTIRKTPDEIGEEADSIGVLPTTKEEERLFFKQTGMTRKTTKSHGQKRFRRCFTTGLPAGSDKTDDRLN